jgi:hypothetical protein
MPQSTPLQVHRLGFTRLSRDDSSLARSPKFNIISVHGLRGHPQRTWEHRQIVANEQTTPEPSRRRRDRLNPFSRQRNATAARATADDKTISNNVFWPRDYLVDDFPETEVWTYGYNADVIGGVFQANNQNSVSQHGRDLAVKLERSIENEANSPGWRLRQVSLTGHYRCRSSL